MVMAVIASENSKYSGKQVVSDHCHRDREHLWIFTAMAAKPCENKNKKAQRFRIVPWSSSKEKGLFGGRRLSRISQDCSLSYHRRVVATKFTTSKSPFIFVCKL